jgi:hypothetical protein
MSDEPVYTPRAEYQCDGSTTHYMGCKCHEARRDAEREKLLDRIDILEKTESKKISELSERAAQDTLQMRKLADRVKELENQIFEMSAFNQQTCLMYREQMSETIEAAQELLDEIDSQAEMGGPTFEGSEPLKEALNVFSSPRQDYQSVGGCIQAEVGVSPTPPASTTAQAEQKTQLNCQLDSRAVEAAKSYERDTEGYVLPSDAFMAGIIWSIEQTLQPGPEETTQACKHEFEFKRTFNICKHCGADSAECTSNEGEAK